MTDKNNKCKEKSGHNVLFCTSHQIEMNNIVKALDWVMDTL